jgi:hypothetical protein
MVFNATFSYIVAVSFIDGGNQEYPGENHQHDAKYLQTLSYNVVSSTLRHERESNSLNVSGDRH